MSRLDWIPRCRYEVWSKQFAGVHAGKVLGLGVGVCTELVGTKRDGEGLFEAPDVEEAGELR